MKLKSLLGLLACNLVWSIHPVMAKTLVSTFTPGQTALFRYTSAFIAFLIAGAFVKRRIFFIPNVNHQSRRPVFYLFGLAFLAFCFSPMTQLTGLLSSSAVDNSVIVSLEPLLTAVFAWIFLKEMLPPVYYLLFVVALGGYFLLSGLDVRSLHWFGNALMLLSVMAESSYSIFARKLMDPPTRAFPIPIFGSALGLGVVLLWIMMALFSPHEITTLFDRFNLQSAAVILWMGPLGTSLTYLYWMMVLKEVPVSLMALTLFVQPVLGLAWGMLFLGERFTFTQGMGALLILGAVLMAGFVRRKPVVPSQPLMKS